MQIEPPERGAYAPWSAAALVLAPLLQALDEAIDDRGAPDLSLLDGRHLFVGRVSPQAEGSTPQSESLVVAERRVVGPEDVENRVANVAFEHVAGRLVARGGFRVERFDLRESF